MLRARGAVFRSAGTEPNLACDYPASIDLALNELPFAVPNQSEKGNYKPFWFNFTRFRIRKTSFCDNYSRKNVSCKKKLENQRRKFCDCMQGKIFSFSVELFKFKYLLQKTYKLQFNI